MTAERAARLTALGLVWTSGQTGYTNTRMGPSVPCISAKWEAQLARLAAYKADHGDCNVLQGWAEDPYLGIWVNNQRAYKRKLDRGNPSPGMTAARAVRLEALGLAWAPSRGGPARR